MTVLEKIRHAAIATSAAAICGMAGMAHSQDAEAGGGFTGALTVSPRLALSDREDGELTPQVNFNLLLSDITKSQALTFEATGGIERALGGDESDSSVDSPRLRAGYLRETRETAIGFDATYSRIDLNDNFVDPLNGFLIVDDGTRSDLSLGTNIEFGRESPFGGTFSARRSWREFDGSTDARYQDAVTDAAALSLIFRVDPRLDVIAGVDFEDVDADDPGTDRQIRNARIGVSAAVTQTLTVDAGVTYGQTERSGPLVADRTEEGFGFDLGGTLERPNGALTARLTTGIEENGRRTRVDFGRTLDLRDGGLSFGLGLVHTEDGGGVDPLYSFAYSKILPLGELSAALQQSYVSDIDGDETISTTLSLGYSRQIGPLDRIRASYILQDSNVQSGIEDDARRSEFGLTYSRDVTRDWALVAGYTHERDDSDNVDTDAENEVFLGIERTFTWRN